MLELGDFARGLPEYEWRWRRESEMKPRDFAQPVWQGEDLGGKTILLHAEQGFGDSIQLLRYVPMVVAKGGQVVLEIPDSLMPLIGRIDGVLAMVKPGAPLPPFDLHCPLLSLPLAFGTTLATIPAQVPYLRAPAERAAKWRSWLPDTGRPRVGMVWSGKPTHKNDHNRSIALHRLAPLLSLPGIDFVSLQREYRETDLAALAAFPNLLRLDTALVDFADTAAAVEALDLVITCRHRGGASRRRAGQAGLDPVVLYSGLALALAARGQPLVPERPAVPAAGDRRLGQRDRPRGA